MHGIDRADIEIEESRTTLLAGGNGQGKSSIINAATAVLLPRPYPAGTTKKFPIINNAHKDAFVKFESGYVTRQVTYPSAEVHTLAGYGIACDEWAVGEWKMVDFKEEDRAKFLTELAGTKPTRERVEIELKDLNIEADKLKSLIDSALNISFEVASKTAEGWAKELKGEFKVITGVQWGSNQGLTFRPEGWTDDLATSTRENLVACVESAKKTLEDAIGKAALYRAAGDKEAIAKEIAEWSEKLENYEQSVNDARTMLDAKQQSSKVVKCSGCGLEGTVEGSSLVARPQAVGSTESDMSELQRTLKQAESGRNNAQLALGVAKGKFENAEGAGEPVEVQPFRDQAQLAERRLKAFDAKHKGTDLHYRISDMLKAAEVLSPDGLPKTALLEGVKVLNVQLAKLCEIAEWGRVDIDDSLMLRYEGRVYHRRILSKSERYKCDVTFQVLWARIKKSQVVLVDDADDLRDYAAQEGLFTLLHACKLTALVGMACADAPPDLEAAGIGETYIVERGTARKMKEAVQA